MKRLSPFFLLLIVALAACQQVQGVRAIPSVAQIGGDLNCAAGDHGFEDADAGWGFCYPMTWQYVEKSQSTSNPNRLDLTFDVTNVPCPSAAPVPGASPDPKCKDSGLFAFMIISTYERGSVPGLLSWMQANLGSVPDRQAIVWGNATEADRLSDGRRIALTPTRVVIMDLRSGPGQLDLETQMSARLSTWKFFV
jgi:hypothetical protein